MSPEIIQNPNIKKESVDDLTEGLSTRYENTRLNPGIVHEIPPLSQHMSRCDDSLGAQFLRTIIKVDDGEDFFSIVDVSRGDNGIALSETILTYHQPDKKATLVGYLNKGGGSVTVGRYYQGNLKDTTSRNHFSAAQTLEGSLCIVDLNSANGTKVFGPLENSEASHEQNLADTKNPALDTDFWSIDLKTL